MGTAVTPFGSLRGFEALGLPEEDLPTTWADFEALILPRLRRAPELRVYLYLERETGAKAGPPSRNSVVAGLARMDLQALDRARLLLVLNHTLPPHKDGWTQSWELHGSASLDELVEGLAVDLAAKHGPARTGGELWERAQARLDTIFGSLDWGAPDAPTRPPALPAGAHGSLLRLAAASAASIHLARWGRHEAALHMLAENPLEPECRAWQAFTRATVHAYVAQDPHPEVVRFVDEFGADALLPPWPVFEATIAPWPWAWMPPLAGLLYQAQLPDVLRWGIIITAVRYHAENHEPDHARAWLSRIPRSQVSKLPRGFKISYDWFRECLPQDSGHRGGYPENQP